MGRIFDECSKGRYFLSSSYPNLIIFLNLGTGRLTREQFQEALGRLESCGLNKFKNLPMGERLFDLFDANKDNCVDQREFVSGMRVLNCITVFAEKLTSAQGSQSCVKEQMMKS